MAAAKGRSPVEIKLEVYLSTDLVPVIKSTVVNDICKFLSSDVTQLNKHFKKEGMTGIVISSISMQKGHLIVSFTIQNIKDLDDFKELSNSGLLSKAFTGYSWKNGLDALVGSKTNTSIQFHLDMDEETYRIAQVCFEKDTGIFLDENQAGNPDKIETNSASQRVQHTDTEITSSDCQMLRKKVVLVRPDSEDWKHIDAIKLMTGNKIYPMEKQSERIWSVVIEIPSTKLTEYVGFRLVVDAISHSTIGIGDTFCVNWKKRRRTLESLLYIMTDSEIERVVWNKTLPEVSELAEHYVDIVITYSDNCPLLQCCMQIENVSKNLHLRKHMVGGIYRHICDMIDRKSEKHWLLILVVLGNIFKTYSCAAEILPVSEINNMLKAIRRFRLSDLTTASSSYMPALILELCKKAQGECYCFLMFVSASYPFLDEQKLSDMLMNVVKGRVSIVPNTMDKVEMEILQVCENIYDRTNSDTSRKFLNQLLLHSPTTLTVKAYAFIKQRRKSASFAEESVSKVILDSVLASLKSFLKSSQRTSLELADIWDILESCSDLEEVAKPEFEKAFIRTIHKISKKDTERMKNIVLRTQMFESIAQQTEIIETLAHVRSPEPHYFLFEILSNPKFREAAEKSSLKWLNLCLENAILELKKGNTTEQKLKDVYSYLSEASELPIIRANEELQDVITTTAVEFLRQFDLKQLMRSAKVIEELAEKRLSVGELFKMHVKALLHRQQRNDYHEVLISLCGTCGEIRVNSRLTADIVCTILDLSAIGKDSSVAKGFQEVLKQYDLWMAVFKANGKYLHQVELSNSYKQTSRYVELMMKLFQTGDIQYGVLENLTKMKTKREIIDILCLVTNVAKTSVSNQWAFIEKHFKNEVDKLSDSCTVLNAIQSHMSSKVVPVSIKQIIERLGNLQKSIQTGLLTAKQLEDSKYIWQELIDLPESCSFLCVYVKSKIFWTSCTETVETMFEEDRKQLRLRSQEGEPLVSIHDLFDEQITDTVINEDQESLEDEFAETFLLLKLLTKEGIAAYKKAWSGLIKEHDKDVRFALKLLHSVSIDIEIENAEKVLHEPIPSFIKNTLRRLMDLTRYEDTVDAVKNSLDVFKIKVDESDSLFTSIHAFETIKECKDENCPFSLVVQSLEKVDTMSKEITSETIDILNALGQSSLLVEFLNEIVEEDIRNLIDAVDCISEQQVQESAVSALIDVKGFLHGILIKTSQGLTAHDFITSLNKQTKTLSSTALQQLPTKIHDCSSSLHNLKSLYGNVANRGAMTVEIINNIIARGKFAFKLNKDGVCIFHAAYKHGPEKEEHFKPSLMDLRSRALLLMNTRTKSHNRKISGDTLEKFVNYVDLSIEIADLCDELHQSGNIEFMTYMSTTDCNGLNTLRQKLLNKNESWKQTLQQMRKKYYLLNFIHGPEIHMLYNFFENEIGEEKVKTILRFIHPAIEIGPLLKEYRCVKSSENDWLNENVIDCIGSVLHFGYEGNQPVQRPFHFNVRAKKLTDIVQSRKLFVADLEENSNQVVKTLLALYLNSTHILPEPHQVLFCTRDTTWNELELLLFRCFGSSGFTKMPQLFCIANIEMLVNELQFRLVEALKNLDTDESYLLALICRGSSRHPFLDELSSFTGKASLNLSDEEVRQAFQNQCPEVVTTTSAVSGLGKSNRIKEYSFSADKSIATLHISGPFYKRKIIDKMSMINVRKQHALHIDVGNVDNPFELDTFIFELIILRYVTAGFTAVSLETNHVFIEVANTINDSLRNSLNTAMYFKREHLTWKNYDDFHVSMEQNSPVQVVCQYLKCSDMGSLDKRDVILTGSKSVNCLEPETCRGLLRKHFGTDSELSFTVVNIFLQILADQLKKMSCSTFLKVSRVSDMMGHETLSNVRSTLVNALTEASKEFSSRSIAACRSTQISTMGTDPEKIDDQTSSKSKALKFVELVNQRVDGMIRWEDSNHLIFVFHNQNIQTLSPLYRDLQMVPRHIKTLFESQLKRTMQDFAQMDQNQLQILLQRVARTNPQYLPKEKLSILNAEYALTPDNLLKMVLIMLRVKSQIPVVIMGETGCGKTSLVRYLATITDVHFEILSIHAGIEEDEIISTIRQNNEQALSSPERERWLFLDEINTSEHIGLISNAICSRTFLDKVLAPSMVVMGACNPYKLRTESAVSTAGLTEKVKTDDLSKLVYRVLPLPERMVDYVWDFGSISDKDEAIYIERMVTGIFPCRKDLQQLLQELLSQSQKFVRRTEDVSYCVSLRDIQRCKTLIKWFLHILRIKDPSQDVILKSVILALSICYHSRFAKSAQRETYRQELQQVFFACEFASITEERIQNIIFEEQKDFLRRMELPAGTAKNTALQENVFVILVCLLNQIPIFLVGKPGCSKSLSMQIIRSNLRGKDSKDSFFKALPQLYCVSFQGSESSTSDGIIKVFEKAERYQKSNNKDDVVSVVILDEIGLAEISKFNPLKVLHSLLEPDGRPQPNVAVVGISNWALDASKMNRAIHLSRPDMDEQELYQTGVSISESFLETRQQTSSKLFYSSHTIVSLNSLKKTLEDIAKSYLKYTERLRFKNFHGLRDYYSLVKFVSKTLIEAFDANNVVSENEKEQIILEGLQRNFGGLPSESPTLFSVFQIEVNKETMEKVNILKLMKDNIADKMARHLMCITSGETVLSLIENVLKDMNREEKVVIFGSHFEEDQTADYNYRILSRIILCMEQGLILILRDLENIYGSLYDMLNQNYTIIGKKKHCRIALGHYSNPICQVHDDFRCIVLVDEGNVDFSDPPFLNRFEKQYLKFTAIINSEERILIEDIQSYVDRFSSVKNCHFDTHDCFPLYTQDLIPSLVISICRDCSRENDLQSEQLMEECKTKLLLIAQPDAIIRLGQSVYEDIQQNSEQIKEHFLKLPIHSGIWHFIENQVTREDNRQKSLMTVVLTNSSIHTQTFHKKQKYEIQVEKLGAFKSEKQLSLRLQHFWLDSPASMLFLHCSVVEDEKHISLAKTTIENTRTSALREKSDLRKHVYIILHLDRRRTEEITGLPVNFLSGWELVLLDSIEEPEIPLPLLCKMSLFDTVLKKTPLTKYITEQLFWSFTTIRYQRHGRDIESIHKIIEQIKNSDDLLQILEDLICECIVSEFDTLNNLDWHERIAMDAYSLNTSSSFMTALEEEVFTAVSTPLSKLVYHLENINALSSYFYDKQNSQRREVWERMIHDKSLLSVIDTPPQSGPECYLCTAADLTLRMPLSKLVYDKIEETKDDFIDSFIFVKGKCDITEDDEMPEQVMEELFSQHESVVKDNLPDLTSFMYDSLSDDYFHDFANFVSYASTSGIREDIRIKIVRWTLSQKINLHTDAPLELLVKLHATSWIFSSVLSAELQLFDMCAEIFNVEENFTELMDTFHHDLQQNSGLESYSGISLEPFPAGQYLLNDRDTNVSCGETFTCTQSLYTEDVIPEDEQRESISHTVCVKQTADENNTSGIDFEETPDEIETDKVKPVSDGTVSDEGESLFTPEENILQYDSEHTNVYVDFHDEKQNQPQNETENHGSQEEDTGSFSLNNPTFVSFSSEESLTEDKDSRVKLVEFISLKMMPTQSCIELFKSVEDWNARVSILLTHALVVSSEPRAFHNLRFFQDLVCVLHLHLKDANMKTVYQLGDILQSDREKSLDSEECFECIYDLLFMDNKHTAQEIQSIMAAYLNRCLAGDAELQAMIFFLRLVKDKKIMVENSVAFKPPFHLAINLELEDTEDENESVYKNLIRDMDVALEERPFLFALEETLRSFQGTVDVDSQLAVLVVDILEEYFDKLLAEKIESDIETIKSDLLSAHKLVLSCEYGIRFLSAVSFYKAFAKLLGNMLVDKNFDITQCDTFLPEIQAVLNKDEKHLISMSLRHFIIKAFGQDLLPWKLYKACEKMEKNVESFECSDWSEKYINCSIEGNPLFSHAPMTFKMVENALSEKDKKKRAVLLKDILRSSKDQTVTLAIHGVALSRFYIQRSYKQQDDTCNQLAKTLKQIATDENMDEANSSFLACLLGTNSFSYSDLELNEESNEGQSFIAFFCCSLFAVILASNQKSRGDELSLLAKCLLCPLKLKANILCSLRTMNYPKESKPVSNEEFFGLCSCGHRVTQRKKEDNVLRCPICSEEMPESFETVNEQTLKTEHTFECHSVSAVSVKLIGLFVDVCLLGSLALNHSTGQDLENITCTSEVDNVSSTLMKRVSDIFTELKNMMDMSCRDLFIFLQACLLQLKGFLTENKVSVDTAEQMLEWSMQFDSETKPLAAERFETVTNMVREQSKLTGIPDDAAELCVNENDTCSLDIENRTQLFPSVFRMQGRPSVIALRYELDMLDICSDDFPFLAFVLKSLPELAITEMIFPLIQWHLATVTHIGYRFKRQECLDMTVQDFIYHDESEKMRLVLKNRFDKLQSSLSMIVDSQYKLVTPIERLNYRTKMKDCLLLNSTSTMYKIIKELVDIQNNFLDRTLLISVRSNCQALKCLSRGDVSAAVPSRAISEVSPSSVVSYQWDEELLKFSHADLNYGCGKHVRYEFAAIEKSLALDLVVGKCYVLLDSNLPSVVFVDEFYKGFSKLVRDVSVLVPQRELSTDSVNGIKAKRNKHPRLTADLITHVGVLIALAKKTKGDPDQPVIEYVEKWKSYLTRPLPFELLPTPEDSIKLCHLVALYGLLEELNADSLVESLSDKYRGTLNRDSETQLIEILRCDRKTAETILKATKRFTYRCLSAGEVDCSRALSEYLEDDSFWPFDFGGLKEKSGERHPLDLIPADLKVQHLYQMISMMEQKLKELTEKEIKLTHIASFKPPTNVSKADRKKKMAQKRRV